MNSHSKLELLKKELNDYIFYLDSFDYKIHSKKVSAHLSTILSKVEVKK